MCEAPETRAGECQKLLKGEESPQACHCKLRWPRVAPCSSTTLTTFRAASSIAVVHQYRRSQRTRA
jgi:hypothetical protein